MLWTAVGGLELNGQLPGPSGSLSRLLFSHLHVSVSLLVTLSERKSQSVVKEVSRHISCCDPKAFSCQGKVSALSP